MIPKTVRLRDGSLVLSKLYLGEPSALTYANRTQAQRAVDALKLDGYDAEIIQRGRPFYARIRAMPVDIACNDDPPRYILAKNV